MNQPDNRLNKVGNLRNRLLLGSISLSILVSIIFIVVSYRLSADMGYELELSSLKNKAAVIADYKLQPHSQPSLNLINDIDNNLFHYSKNGTISGIWDLKNNEWVYLSDDKNYYTELIEQIQTSKLSKSSGQIELQGTNYIWTIYQTAQLDLLVIGNTNALDIALEYISKRLSVTAFFTFWLAIWAALIISTLITKQFEENHNKVLHLAMHDPLTNLPNRYYLKENFSRLIEGQTKKGALFLLDLDKFKEINDSFGHSIGDELLIKVANRLKEIAGDSALTVRLSGDEFVIWVKDIEDYQAKNLAEKLLSGVNKPFNLTHESFSVGVSIGITMLQQDSLDISLLLKSTDYAMYRAKQLRKGYEFYNSNIDNTSSLSSELRAQLATALSDKQIVIYYQPKLNTHDKSLFGFEALARWDHPKHGILSPTIFIDLFEQSQLINEFTRYIISEVLSQMRQWQNQGVFTSVSVNLSYYNLLDAKLVTHLSEELDKYAIHPSCLECELTESVTMVDLNTSISMISKLKQIGVKLSIDDFGKGVSSLAYIKNLNVDTIKLDKQFIDTLHQNDDDVKMTKAVIGLCHSLDRKVVAEGVEQLAQFDILLALNCDYVQGYLFAKPMNADKTFKYIQLFNKRLPAIL